MLKPSRFAGLAIIVFTFIAMVKVTPGVSLAVFIDIPSAIWILGIVFGGLLIAFPLGTILRAVRHGLQQPHENDDVLTDASVFARAHQLTWAAGIAGLLVSCIGFLGNMDNPEAIGPALAVAMICPLYAAFLAEVILLPIRQSLINSATPAGLEMETLQQAPSDLPASPIRERGLIIVAFLLALFFGLTLANTEAQPPVFPTFGEETYEEHFKSYKEQAARQK